MNNPISFNEWCKLHKINITTKEYIDLYMYAKRRKTTVEKLLGYPH